MSSPDVAQAARAETGTPLYHRVPRPLWDDPDRALLSFSARFYIRLKNRYP